MLPDDEAGRWMLDRVTEAEGAAATNAALIVTTTESDARALEDDHGLTKGSVLVVPNGVDTISSASSPPRPTDEAHGPGALERLCPHRRAADIALFVGSAHRPNIDAARELLAIAPQLPEVLFLLAGEHSDQIDSHDCPPNVRLPGSSDRRSAGPPAGRRRCGRQPHGSGGGSNLKVLDYFAAGVPVVSTPTGVRGIDEPDRLATVVRIDRFTDALGRSSPIPPATAGREKLGRRTEAARRWSRPATTGGSSRGGSPIRWPQWLRLGHARSARPLEHRIHGAPRSESIPPPSTSKSPPPSRHASPPATSAWCGASSRRPTASRTIRWTLVPVVAAHRDQHRRLTDDDGRAWPNTLREARTADVPTASARCRP